jgi:hypothetical protein
MAITASARRYYKLRSKNSMCSGKKPKPCRKIKSCRMTKTTTKRVHFCRKRTNTRRVRK